MRAHLLRLNKCWLWSALGAVSMVCSLQAQAPSPAEVPAPTIRVSTHLVLVDVVATDKQGKAVTGLRAEDFVVEENGKQQKISTFTTHVENSPAPPELPPGIYTNRPQYRSPGGPITVLLLDAINTPFKDQAYARVQMLKFVQQSFKPGERMGIFTLTGSLRVLQDLTGDPQVLYTALQRFRPIHNEYTPSSAALPSGPAGQTDASLVPPSDSGGAVARWVHESPHK
jgi:VWFA-related protein